MKNSQEGSLRPTWPHHWLPSLGRLRDGALLLASTAYACGYVVWSVVALQSQVGALPVADSQYFVAGIPVILLAVAILYAATGVRVLSSLWHPFVRRLAVRRSPPVVGLVTLIVALSLVVFSAVLLLRPFSQPPSARVTPRGLFIYPILWGAYVLMLLGTEATELSRTRRPFAQRLLPFLRVVTLIVMPVSLLVVGCAAYVNNYFPHLPQELGGARPKLARLDISRRALAGPTATALGWSMAAAPSPTFETGRVAVIFMSKETLIVVPVAIPCLPRPIALAREDVHAIEWLDGDETEGPGSPPGTTALSGNEE